MVKHHDRRDQNADMVGSVSRYEQIVAELRKVVENQPRGQWLIV
ncbi:hypothetical protein ACGF3J_38370 [Streptomyces sp. NPDC048171]